MKPLIENMRRADNGLVAVDTETTGIAGIKNGFDYLVGISIAYRVNGVLLSEYYPFRHSSNNHDEATKDQIQEQLSWASSHGGLIFHNAKFDIHSLATLDRNKWGWLFEYGTFFDTAIIAHMYNEELPSKKLDWLGKKFLNDGKDRSELEKYTKVFGWSDVPVELMAPYAQKDAELTYRLFEHLWPQLKREDLDGLWTYEMEFIRTLARVERNGLLFIPEPALEMYEQGTKRLSEIENEYGFELSKSTELKRLFFDELGMPVVEFTCGCAVGWDDTQCRKKATHGKPSLNKAALTQYEEMLEVSENPLAIRVLEYRGWQKAVSSWYESFPKLVGNDGRIRTNFHINGTRTSRLSSTEPNLQQLPRSTNQPWNCRVRECFGPKDGFTLVKFDFKTLELRLAADYCDITPMLTGFTEGISPHLVTQQQLGIPYNDAKNTNFAMLYGAGARKLAWMLNYRKPNGEIDEPRGKAVHEGFKNSYPGFKQVTSMATQRAKSRGYVRYWSGRRKHYNFYNKGEEQKAFNALMQGGGAEVVKRAILNCREIESESARPVLTVHDEYDWEIETSKLDYYIPLIKEAMEIPPPDANFRVKFEVEHEVWK